MQEIMTFIGMSREHHVNAEILKGFEFGLIEFFDFILVFFFCLVLLFHLRLQCFVDFTIASSSVHSIFLMDMVYIQKVKELDFEICHFRWFDKLAIQSSGDDLYFDPVFCFYHHL